MEVVSLDLAAFEQTYQVEAHRAESAEAAFDRQWAETVFTRAVARLRGEQESRQRGEFYAALKPHLTELGRVNLETAAARLGMTSNAVAVGLHRLRQRLRELVLEELSETVGSHADLDDELRYFISVWSR